MKFRGRGPASGAGGRELRDLLRDKRCLRADGHLYQCLFYIRLAYERFVLSCREESSFVEKVCKVCARKADCRLRNAREINRLFEGLVSCVNTENFLSALYIRIADCYLTVETTGAEKGGVKNIGAVCCRHNDDSVVRAETVHLNEELV